MDDRRTYRAIEVLAAAAHVSAVIRAKSESPVVGLLLPTSGALPIGALGAWMAGKVVVPLNYLLKPEELQYVIDDSGMDMIVASKQLLDHVGVAPKVGHLVEMESIDFRVFPEPMAPIFADDDQLAVLLYTSGTSGKPKGVMLTHANLRANIGQILDWVDLGPGDVALGVLPQFHSFGLTVLTLLPLTAGFKAVYTARFVPAKLLRLIREHRPTIFVAIPSMYTALLHLKDAKPEDFASMRFIVSGGEPLPRATFDGFRDRFHITLNEGYGLTETSPVTNWCRPEEFRLGSVGKALPRLEQRVVDPHSNLGVGPDVDGEVQMRGPNIMRGYFRLPEETARAFTPDGFFRSGDMGRMSADGHLFITGRIKEMLIVGGENVFPREIEEVLNRHPSVAASGVVGKQDPLRGEQPLAFVEPKEGMTCDERELLAHCRASLAGYKVPVEVRVLSQLPRNATGKIMRKELVKLVGGEG